MHAMLRRKSEGLAKDALEFASTLVRTPSPSFQEGPVADLVEREMRRLGYDEVVRDGFGNVAGILHGRESQPVLLLNGHMDTAAAGAESSWNEPVYSGRRSDGMLRGLGASDCKGGLAAQVYAGAVLKRNLLPLRGTIVVAATVAEEDGGSPGVRALVGETLRDLELKPDYALLCDPTDLGLYYGHDGWIEMDICVQGSNPFHVRDAARAIADGIEGGGRVAAVGEPEDLGGAFPPPREAESGVSGARLRVVRRLLPSESEEDVLGETRRSVGVLTQSAGSVAVQVSVRTEEQRLYTGRMTVVRHVTHAWATDPFHALMTRSRQALAAAGCEVRPGKWALGRLGMGTSGSVLVGELSIPTIGYGPGSETKCHAPNEAVSEASVAEAMYGTAAIAHALAGIPVCGWTSDEI